MIARHAASSSRRPRERQQQRPTMRRQPTVATVDRRAGRAQDEALAGRTSSATASPVTQRPRRRTGPTRRPDGGRGGHGVVFKQMDLDALRRRPPRRLGAPRRARARAGSTAPRPTSSSSATRPAAPSSRSMQDDGRVDGARRPALGRRSSRARLRFTGAPENPLRQFTRFVARAAARRPLPAALAHARGRASPRSSSPRCTRCVVGGDPRVLADARHARTSCASSPRRTSSPTTPRTRRRRSPAQVWTNNAWIAAQCVAFGIIGRLGAVRDPAERAGPRASRRRSCSPTTRPTRSSSTSRRTASSSSRASSSPRRRASGSSGRGSRPGARRAASGARRGRPRAVHASRSGSCSVLLRLGHHRGLRDAGRTGRGPSRSASARSRSAAFLAYMLVLGGRALRAPARPATSTSSTRARSAHRRRLSELASATGVSEPAGAPSARGSGRRGPAAARPGRRGHGRSPPSVGATAAATRVGVEQARARPRRRRVDLVERSPRSRARGRRRPGRRRRRRPRCGVRVSCGSTESSPRELPGRVGRGEQHDEGALARDRRTWPGTDAQSVSMSSASMPRHGVDHPGEQLGAARALHAARARVGPRRGSRRGRRRATRGRRAAATPRRPCRGAARRRCARRRCATCRRRSRCGGRARAARCAP